MANTRALAEQNLADYEAFQRRPAASIEHWPVELQIEITARCGGNCPMCLRHEVSRPYGQDLAPELLTTVRPALERATTFAPFGLGDPLLSKQLFGLMEAARDLGLYQIIYTRGDLLDPLRRARLIAAGLDRLVVSISGATPASYAMAHGVDSHQIVCSNVSRFAEWLTAQGRSRPSLGINFIVTNLSYEEIPAIVDLAESLGVGDVLLSPVICTRGEFTGWRWRGTDEQWQALYGWADEARARHITLHLDTLERARSPKHDGYCLHPFRQAYVTAEGDVYPCCSGQYAGGEFIFGSLRDEPFEAIWFGQAATKFRARILDRDRPQACSVCRAAAMCAYSEDAPPDTEHFKEVLESKSRGRRYLASPPGALVEVLKTKLPNHGPIVVFEPSGSHLGRTLSKRLGLNVRSRGDGTAPPGSYVLAVLDGRIDSPEALRTVKACATDVTDLRVLFLADGIGPTRWQQWNYWEHVCHALVGVGQVVVDAAVLSGEACAWFLHLRPIKAANGLCAHPEGLEPLRPGEEGHVGAARVALRRTQGQTVELRERIKQAAARSAELNREIAQLESRLQRFEQFFPVRLWRWAARVARRTGTAAAGGTKAPRNNPRRGRKG